MALMTRYFLDFRGSWFRGLPQSMHGAGPESAGLMEAVERAWSRERLGSVCERRPGRGVCLCA